MTCPPLYRHGDASVEKFFGRHGDMANFRGTLVLLYVHICTLTFWGPAHLASSQSTYPSEFKMDYCVFEDCYSFVFSCAHFQSRTWAFYRNETTRPPLKESWFLIGEFGISSKVGSPARIVDIAEKPKNGSRRRVYGLQAVSACFGCMRMGCIPDKLSYG